MSEVTYYFLGFTAIYILMGWALYLTYRVGQLHFLIVACMAISAYFGGYAAKEWGWPFVLVLISGILISTVIGFIFSLAIGKAPCFTVVIVGLTSIFIVKTVIENWKLLGGTIGFFHVPSVNNILFIIYFLLIITGSLIYRIDHSRLGRAASVVFVDREVAITLGVDIKKLGMFFQITSCAIAGMSGILDVFLVRSLSPEFFSFSMIGYLMCILFVGGYTTMWGVIPSAFLLQGIPLIFSSNIASWRQVIYGALLVIIILLRPEGMITRKMLWNMKPKVPQQAINK
ncbi:MAG: branched-chain amino acid ABC transporter permease [Atribacterota bacterium]|nr:branched-chain amino acid ABC transporter permease [Atribacterota bacterium]MDD4896217.1 branched-chain amino acid ABC transporter permease [Atribacterota bacterium]MDD5638236.1 branched-chain amino acid ABC transporter permease [Atribacterota bacterium]